MTARPFAEQERELLKELADLFALRARQESTLPARLAEALDQAQVEHRKSTQQARQVFEAALAEASAEHQSRHARIETDFGPKFDAASTLMNAELAAFRERTQALAKDVAAKHEEGKWLAETMLESGHGRIRAAYESTRKTIAQRTAELHLVEKTVNAALGQAGHDPLNAVPPLSGEPAASAAGVPPQVRSLDDAVIAVRHATLNLESTMHPSLLRPLNVVMIILGGMVAGAGIGGGRLWTDPLAALPRAFLGALTGAAVGLGTVLACRALLRRRVAPMANTLRDALTSAHQSAANASHAAAAAKETEIADLKARTTREWVDSEKSVAVLQADVSRRYRELEPEIRAGHENSIAAIRAQQDSLFAEIDGALADRRAAMEAELAATSRAADDRLAQSKAQLEQADREQRNALRQTWSARITAAMEQTEALVAAGARNTPPWDSPAWEHVSPSPATPPGVRFGELRLDLAALPGGLSPDPSLAVPGPTARNLPLMIDLLGRGSVLLRAAPQQRDRALGVLNNIMLRLLTGLPPGKARFTIVDPVGLGQSFAGLMHLSDYEEAIVGERIWTDPRHIEQRLTDLTEHMETVIQKYLRNQYETIQAYNAEAGEVAEPYRFLVIADCPTSITEGAAKRLASIATSGARCGVFLLLMTAQQPPRTADATKRAAPPPPGGFPWAEIERNSMVLCLSDLGVRWTEDPFAPWPIELEHPPAEEASTRLMHQIGELAKDSTRVQVPFQIVDPPEGRLWDADSALEIRLPLGRAGARKIQYLTLGRGTAQHALIAGRTGSGKSTLLHVIITTAALWYSPDQVELYLVDFKKGVEFKTYATHDLAHARVVAVESEREFGLSVLRRLDAEITRRGNLFRDAGVQDLPAYRRWQAQQADPAPMPRIMLIVDEFQEFFVEDDKLAQDAGLLLDRLVRQGRAFGMHVILGSQTLGGAYTLARSTLGQMAVRIALQCSEADSYLIMSEDNPAPRLLSRPGEAIYNDASGLMEGNSPFQIVWLPDEIRELRLRAVRQHASAEGRSRPPQIVFEGNTPGVMARNHLLSGLVERRTPRSPVPILWLGEPLAIKDPTGVPLRHQSAASTLIVGNQDEQGAAMLVGAVLSLAAWMGAEPDAQAGGPAITILDATPPDVDHADLMGVLTAGLGGWARLVGPRKTDAPLTELAAEIDRREASGLTTHAPRLLVINGLQRFRELRKSDEFAFASDPAQAQSPAPLLAKILRSGPSVGIHSLIWCDTATNVERMLERSALREFNSRVLMQMSAGDSTQLIESPAAAALGRHRSLLYSDETGTVEKFRPYAVPSPDWITSTLKLLCATAWPRP